MRQWWFLLGLAGCPRPAVSGVEPGTGDIDRTVILDATTLTAVDLQAMVDALRPLVEEAAGARFAEVPQVELGSPETLMEIVVEEGREIVHKLYQAPEEVLEQMAEASRLAVPSIVGKYATRTHRLYLSTDAVESMVESHDWPDTWTRPVCMLVLAHEMTHALQDQEADLDTQIATLRDMDHFNGLRGVTEGHANHVEGRVAARLGWTDIYDTMNMAQGWTQDGPVVPGAFQIWALYGQGRTFVRWHHARGGDAAAWAVVKAPPATTTMLWRPEQYAATITAPRDYGSLLAGIETVLTRGDWAVINAHLGEFSLREEALGVDQVALTEVLGHVTWGHELDAFRPDRTATVRIVEFDDASWPPRYLALLEDQQAETAAAMSTPDRPWTVEVNPYDAVEGDKVVERVVAPAGPHPSAVEHRSVWVVRGNRLVVVDVAGFRPGLRTDRALEQVFERLASEP